MSFLPYSKQTIDDDDIQAVIDVLKSDFLTTGPQIELFEQAICQNTGSKYAVAVANGTAALHLASCYFLKKDDVVLTTPNTFLATANAILYTGAKPLFVDIKSDGNIDLDICEKYLQENNNIKSIFTVDFSGKRINQDHLKYLREKYQVSIIEDCAHSLGAVFNDKNNNKVMAGNCLNSDCSILSFHPVKHITTGEGGAVTTGSEKIYSRLISMRSHGMIRNEAEFRFKDLAYDQNGNLNPWYYEMHSLGYNYRITDFQCALGTSQLKKLSSFIKRRKEIAGLYSEAFDNQELVQSLYPFSNDSSYHLYVLQIDFNRLNISRARFMMKLKDKGIMTQVHYIPVYLQPFYRSLGYKKGLCPVTEQYYQKTLSIPMYSSMTNDDIHYVIKNINLLLET